MGRAGQRKTMTQPETLQVDILQRYYLRPAGFLGSDSPMSIHACARLVRSSCAGGPNGMEAGTT